MWRHYFPKFPNFGFFRTILAVYHHIPSRYWGCLACSFWKLDLSKEMRTRVDNFIQITVFVYPSLELVPLFTGMQEGFIRYWKVVIATLETYKICVPNNLINKHTVQRGAKQFQVRKPQIKQTLAAQDIWISACQKLNPFSTPKKPE